MCNREKKGKLISKCQRKGVKEPKWHFGWHFENRKVRTIWDDEREEWYFSVVDVIAVLTDSADPNAYWRKLKQRLKEEGNETVTNCHGLKMRAADGKMRLTDVVETQQLFRLIQSIPSPKAEPFKQWIAQVAKERLDQMQDPELSIEQAVRDYRQLGYSEEWINQRLRSIEVRKALTTTKEYKSFKGLKKESLRDNMTNIELALNTLAEASTTELSKNQNPKGFAQNAQVAKQGGSVAKAARDKLESQLGRSVISSAKADDYLLPNQETESED